MSDASQWVAAGAAIAAAAVVSWQSWQTRRSANASEKGVDAAERAVTAALDGLDLSRRQVAEATRARIDANTPQITVIAPDRPNWPPSVTWVPARDVGTPREDLFLPQDAATSITLRAPVHLSNDSQATVDVKAFDFATSQGVFGEHHFPLRPGETTDLWVLVGRRLDEWVEIHRQRDAGDSGPSAGGTLLYEDPADTGATDRWEITISGCPIEPSPSKNGAWRVIDRPDDKTGKHCAMGVGLVIRERTYWLSKRRGERLEP